MPEDDKNLNLPKAEEEILAFWERAHIFEKSLALRQAQGKRNRKGKKEFVFYEGPPYANGKPGIHHVLARSFKDIILRYRTMRGYYVPRKAGWDTHGLPTEIEVEKKLGIKHKKDIEKLGIELFNKYARESVWGYKEEWERLTKRIGYWLDMAHPYITYENNYIETLWWIVARIHERGYLKESQKVVPYCPRCETALASHELGQPGVYKKKKDPSIYIKFKIKEKKNEYLLVWTTTPWTLPANMLIAAAPNLIYTKFRVGKDFVWSYNPPPDADNSVEAVEKISGQKLIGLHYEPLYSVSKMDNATREKNEGKYTSSPMSQFPLANSHRVVAADFISTEDGTGLVHIAPAFGEDDFRLAAALGYDMQNIPVTIDNQGRVLKGFPGAGKFIKDADRDIVDDLVKRRLLYLSASVEHEYPFCWRCGTPLIYFARRAWFFEVSQLRDELVKRNKTINWVPEHLKEGRFGEWVREAKDWAISRERYWGAPLPLWRCKKCDHLIVAGSLDDLDLHDYYRNTFTLVRHSEAQHNITKLCASGPEKGAHISRLTKKGKVQAKKAAEAFKKEKEKVAAIYSSPYARTRALAEEIHKVTGAPVYYDKRIAELDVGVFNWKPIAEHKKFFENPLEEFTKTPPGGENLTDVRKRMFACVREINQKYQGKRIVVVSHGDPLWMLEAALAGVSNEEALKISYIGVGERRNFSMHNWPQTETGEIDIHRPFVDRVVLRCEKCKGTMRRVPEVADVWFDSGAMPFASAHYPFAAQTNADATQKNAGKILRKSASSPRLSASQLAYPADYICEAIDQTRGWFYTLLAVATLLGYEAPYKNVVSLGLINDKFGQKMSKSKGNIVDPWMIIAKYGADAVRWYFYTASPPGEPKNFDENDIAKSFRRFHLILWNSLQYWKTYSSARITNHASRNKNPHSNIEHRTSNILDRWILARLAEGETLVTDHLDHYAIREAALELERLVDDLSRWYIRRSRRRFSSAVKSYGGQAREDYEMASATLSYVLLELSKLTAPFTPFFGEALYREMKGKAQSVHLEDWPLAISKLKSQKSKILLEGMAEVRRMASIGLAKRAEAGIKVRQPLASLKIKNQKSKIKNKELLRILADEVNVKEVLFDPKLKDEAELDIVITPKLKEEGTVREIIRNTQELRQKAEFSPKDIIVLHLNFTGTLLGIAERNEKLIMSEVHAKQIVYKKAQKFSAESETKIDGEDVSMAVGMA